mgnify:CR=1 FL=1
MANAEISFTLDEDSGSGATSEVQYSAKIQAIGSRLNAANNLGEALIRLERYAEGIEALNQALNLDPSHEQSRTKRTEARRALRQQEDSHAPDED